MFRQSVRKVVLGFFVGVLMLTPSANAQDKTRFTSEELNRRTIQRRAVGAVIWGLPLVGEDAVKQAVTSGQNHPKVRSRTGSTPSPIRNGFRGSVCTAQKRPSSTRAGSCRTSRQ